MAGVVYAVEVGIAVAGYPGIVDALVEYVPIEPPSDLSVEV